MKSAIALIALSLALAAPVRPANAQTADAAELLAFPQEIRRSCIAGRAKLYEECGSQVQVLADARAAAAEQGKTVLVLYGAEWCIWCHVLYAHLRGEAGDFSYVMEAAKPVQMAEPEFRSRAIEARTLSSFAAQNFVVAHIESEYSADGATVLASTGALPHFGNWIPFAFVLDADGQYAGKLSEFDDLPELQVRREGSNPYRGYDRIVLTRELLRLRRAAQGATGG